MRGIGLNQSHVSFWKKKRIMASETSETDRIDILPAFTETYIVAYR